MSLTEQQVIDSVACPYCRAKKGQPCHAHPAKGGTRSVKPHSGREAEAWGKAAREKRASA